MMADSSTTNTTNNNMIEADPNNATKVLCTWEAPGVKEREGTTQEMSLLFETLPQELSQHIVTMFPPERLLQLNEIYLQLGQHPECIFTEDDGTKSRHRILDRPCNHAEIDIFAQFFADNMNNHNNNNNNKSRFSSKRKGISGTIHRVSLITDPSCEPEKVLGITVRVGRAMEGLLQTMASGSNFLDPLIANRHSLLLIGRPGVGKSTALREIAFLLSQKSDLIVVVVDKSKELAGDGDIPHPAIGNSRWMPVGKRNLQHEIMLEAVENQSPDVIIVDEISNMAEVQAAQTIAQRGIMLIATVHGNTIPELISDRERGSLVGGCTTVTLSGREAERRPDKSKQVLKRAREPVFQAALELHSRTSWVFHDNIKVSVDGYLDKEPNDAIRLQPGKAVLVTCIPREGMFEYCEKCASVFHGKCFQHTAETMRDNKESNQVGGNPFGDKGKKISRKKGGGKNK